LDVTVILLALPVLLLVGAAIALFIRLISPGPVFFKQERVGHLGKRFMIIKFRTMKVNADPSVHTGHTTMLLRSDAPMLKMDAADCRTLPGLTGLWQVSGKNNTTFHEMVQFDIEYSRTKTLALDVEIIVRTIPALIVQVREMRQNRLAAATPQTPALETNGKPSDLANCRTYRRNSAFPARNSKYFNRSIRPIVGPF
jgi:lipopolysaccharide/colanic/teichoic acid biosynthesis glycosyltransferase